MYSAQQLGWAFMTKGLKRLISLLIRLDYPARVVLLDVQLLKYYPIPPLPFLSKLHHARSKAPGSTRQHDIGDG